jgi:hypothetical protein
VDRLQIQLEPFIDEQARQFIVNGVDYHNIAVTALPDYSRVNFVLHAGEGDAGFWANSGEDGCRVTKLMGC